MAVDGARLGTGQPATRGDTTLATTVRMTLDEFLRRPDDAKPAMEYACGEVFQKPVPTTPHSAIQGYLVVVLFQFLANAGMGRVFPELRCIFGPVGRERAYVPDLVIVATEKLTGDRYLRVAPDLAIEVMSLDQDMARISDKIQFYLLNGVRLVWVIDPEAGTIAVLAPGQEGRTLSAGDTLDGGDILPGFTVTVDDIFAQIQV
jgi:Uma2 family endonuclease